jgi:23S rRNA (guanine745-N1)-methyltransferase
MPEYNSFDFSLICPVCKENLERVPSDKCFRCSNNHSFDISKQGYVNLLTNSQKSSNLPGDSKEMVQARRDFLSGGYYEELSNQLNKFVLKGLKSKVNNSTSLNILDIGCGEGYYTNELFKFSKCKNVSSSFVGLDISRDAIKAASSLNKEILWVVGNSHYLPIKDSSVDCALSVFSPVKIPEIIRVLKDDGILIRVLPGVNHLIQIRNIIYPNVILAEEKDLSIEYDGLKLIDSIKVTYDISLNTEGLLELVRMTPHYWKTSKANKEVLNEIERLIVSIDMQIATFSK